MKRTLIALLILGLLPAWAGAGTIRKSSGVPPAKKIQKTTDGEEYDYIAPGETKQLTYCYFATSYVTPYPYYGVTLVSKPSFISYQIDDVYWESGYIPGLNSYDYYSDITLTASAGAAPGDYQVKLLFRLGFAPTSISESDTLTIHLTVFDPNLPPTPPVLVMPDSGAADQGTDLFFLWIMAPNADRYQLQVADNPSFDPVFMDADYMTTNYLDTTGFQTGTTYFWRMRSINDRLPAVSAWTPAWRFTTYGEPPATVITVDGQKDAFYEGLTGPDDGYLQVKSYAFNNNGIPNSDADLSAKIWTAWDDTWLYVYEEVTDDTISSSQTANAYSNDGIEIKIDPIPADSTVNTVVSLDLTAQYTEGYAGNTNIGTTIPESDKQYARRVTEDGYALELAVKWSAIVSGTNAEMVTPAVGGIFGAAFNTHDNDNSKGTRDASVQWAAYLDDAVWNQPKYHGTVEFLEGNKLKFIPHNAVAARSNAVPYDGTPFYMRVDGKKDPFYTQLTGPDDGYLQLRSYAWNDNGIPKDDKDLSAKVWTAWDNDWFYLYEEVKDDTLSGNATNVWENDGLELKIDPVPTDSAKNSIWATGFTALGKATKNVVSADSLSNVPDSLKKWIRTKVTGGYNLELAVKWPAIKGGTPVETIAPAVDNVFGMAINQHDNDAKAKRQASVQWAAVLLDAAWNQPKYLGTVKFLDDHKLQFVAKNNMTGVENVVPYDGSDYTRSGVEDRTAAPTAFALDQNHPNPFNPSTSIGFTIPSSTDVTVKIYDTLGREIAVLADRTLPAGSHRLEWSASGIGSGVYFCRIQAGEFTAVRKMVLMK